MHLAGAAEFSTFRRTLAAILRPVLGLDNEDDPKLSAWISTHLRVNAMPVTDPDHLAETEAAVLDLLDPPLNLRGRPPTGESRWCRCLTRTAWPRLRQRFLTCLIRR